MRFLCVAVFLAFFVSSFPGSYVLPPPLCFHDFFFAHDDFSKKEISLQRQSSEASRLPVWSSIPAKIQCCILHSTFRILSYICFLTSEFTLSSFNFPRATFKYLPCTFTFSYAIFKFTFKFSGLHFQVFEMLNICQSSFCFQHLLYVFHSQVCIVHSTFQIDHFRITLSLFFKADWCSSFK